MVYRFFVLAFCGRLQLLIAGSGENAWWIYLMSVAKGIDARAVGVVGKI